MSVEHLVLARLGNTRQDIRQKEISPIAFLDSTSIEITLLKLKIVKSAFQVSVRVSLWHVITKVRYSFLISGRLTKYLKTFNVFNSSFFGLKTGGIWYRFDCERNQKNCKRWKSTRALMTQLSLRSKDALFSQFYYCRELKSRNLTIHEAETHRWARVFFQGRGRSFKHPPGPAPRPRPPPPISWVDTTVRVPWNKKSNLINMIRSHMMLQGNRYYNNSQSHAFLRSLKIALFFLPVA